MNIQKLNKLGGAVMRRFTIVVLAVAISLSVSLSQASAQEFAVIINLSNSTDSLDKSNLARIFLGRVKTFPGGHRAVPVTADESNSTRITFEQSVLGKNASQMKAYWTKQLFSGRGRPPENVGADADIMARIASDVNAIGYVPADMVDGTVKVIYQQ